MTKNNSKQVEVNTKKASVSVNLDLDKNGNSHKGDDLDNVTKTKIHLIGGEKGGCGKSFFSKAFVEYCEAINFDDLVIIDADDSNADIYKFYKEIKIVKQAYFSDDPKRIKEADVIFELALSGKNILVNLPAQVFDNLLLWIEDSNLLELALDNDISFIKWFVSNGSVQSADFFLESINSLDIIHVFVRNLALCDDWTFIENMPNFVSAKEKYKFTSINFPRFPHWERNLIEQLQIPFNRALSGSGSELSLVSQSRVRKQFLRPLYSTFENTKLI